jgi:hypothetical protein
MNKRLLAIPLVIALCTFIVVNLAMEKWHYRLRTTQKLAGITAPSKANVVLVGNSLLDGYVDPKTFSEVAQSESEDLHVIDAALLGSGPPVQYLLFQQAEKSHPLKTVVIGFLDFQLTATNTNHPMDILGSSVIAFDKRVSVSDAADAYNFGMLDRLQFALIRSLPLFAYRGNAWKYVEVLRRKMSGMGMPPAREEFADLDMPNLADFDREAQTFAANPTHLNNPMERILQDAKTHGYNVILVLMPVSPSHVSKYYTRPSWIAYEAALKNFSRERGLSFVDGTSWFDRPEDFRDNLHLRVTPNRHLSESLANAVVQADRQPGAGMSAKQEP